MPIRIWIAFGVVCLAVLGSTLDLTPPTPDPYTVEQQVVRMRPVLSELPNVKTAGYISDLPTTTIGGSAAFYAAQYAVAPVLLEEETKHKHDWVIGNFSKPQDYAAAGRPFMLVIAKDVGQGVILFRRVAE
jgi:hypothetical protein